NSGDNWTPVNNGLTNKFVNAIARAATLIFAATSTGIFRSIDNGDNWVLVRSGFFTSLVMSGTDVFAGHGASGVFRSNNNGDNWVSFAFGLTNRIVEAVAVSGARIFAGTRGGGVF